MNIEEIRDYCLSFPEVTEDVKWEGDLCFCIREKMFCVVGLNSDPLAMTVKCTPDHFDELIEKEGFVPAKYLGRYKWVSVMDTSAVASEELKSLIEVSYQLVSKKK